MSKIDLSKANVGDKFRTREGIVVKYVDYDKYLDLYIVSSENDKPYAVQKDGRYLCERECFSDLAGQVLDKPLDELIEEGTKQIKENDDAIAEENELQRRQEVVELAERIFTNCENTTIEDAFCGAETFIKFKNKYLKEGKLC